MISDLRLLLWSAVLATAILYFYFKVKTFLQKFHKLPKTDNRGFCWLIFGDAVELIKAYLGLTEKTLIETFIELSREVMTTHRQKKVLVIWLSWIPFVFVYEASYAEKLLNSPEAIEKSVEYDRLHPWIGTGLLTSGGRKWYVRRKMLSPTFHFRIIHDYLPIINEQCEILINKFNKFIGKEVNISDHIPLAALDVICESTMGFCLGSQSNPKNEYVQAVLSQSEITFARFVDSVIPDWLYSFLPTGRLSKRNLKILHTFTEKIIHEKIEERSHKNFVREYQVVGDEVEKSDYSNIYLKASSKRLAFMDMLVDHYIDQEKYPQEQKLSITDIREEVDTFMFEGFDTTSAAISWTIYLLAHSPDNQKRLFEELSNLDRDEPIDSETLGSLKFTEACVKEALRLFPSVPMIGRTLHQPMKINDYEFPSDISILISIFEMHRDPKIFPEPDEFRPERFLHLDNRPTFSYIPFSAGQRSCIGQVFARFEAKCMVAHIFRNFKVFPSPTCPFDELKFSLELVTRPKSPLNVIFEKRKD